MEEFNIFQAKRAIKQLSMAIIFIMILILGWQYPLLGYFIPICMLLGIGIGLWRGRKWCDWYCPRGSFYDALAKYLSPKKEIPRLFKNLAFRSTMFSILLLIMTFNLIIRWPDPYKIGNFFVMLLTVTTILGMILALIFHQRSWCFLCPIGTVVNLLGRNKYPLRINSDLCIECKMCYKSCPMQIKPYAFKGKSTQVIKDSDCLKCNLCLMACLKNALSR